MTPADSIALEYDEHRDRAFREKFEPLSFRQYLEVMWKIVHSS